MTEAEALRILGIDVGRRGEEATSADVDAEDVRSAFAAQIRLLRSARSDSDSHHERQRIDRAVMLTLLARERLLPDDGPALAATQEFPRIETPRLSWQRCALLLIGVFMVVLGLLPEQPPRLLEASEKPAAAAPASESAAGETSVSRMLLDPVRLKLQARWLQGPLQRLPGETALADLELPILPAGWRWQGQRDGAFAALDPADGDWLLAAPLLENGSLHWACFSARPGRAGCHPLAGDEIVERRLPRGQVAARLLAEALSRLPESQRHEGWSPERWYRQALNQLQRPEEG